MALLSGLNSINFTVDALVIPLLFTFTPRAMNKGKILLLLAHIVPLESKREPFSSDQTNLMSGEKSIVFDILIYP